MRPYDSQLDYMRKRLIYEGKIQHVGDFWTQWNLILTQELDQLCGETVDYQQFRCELAFFKFCWPNEIFVGHDPYNIYVSQLRSMFEKATAQRISRETFDGIWKILTTRPEVVAEPDHNCKQFKAEKMTWEHLWNGQKFPGVDPRSLSNFESHQPFIMSQPPPSRPPCPVGSAILVGEEVEMNRSDAPANTVSFAARIMEEVGYNEGQGFGKDRTGRSSIIEVKQLPPRVGPGIPTAKSRKAMKKEKRRAKRKATLCEHSDEKRAKHKQEVKDLGRTSGTGSKSLVNFSNEIDDSTDTGSMDRNVEILKGKRAGHARMQKDVTKKARLGVRIDDHSQG